MAVHTVLQLLLLLACSSSTTTARTPLAGRASGSEVPKKQQVIIRKYPAANCPNKCGDKAIEFPFGIGPDCFRHPDFALICNNTTSPPRLFLMDRITEVLDEGYQASQGVIYVNISFTIPGVDVYNARWEAPASNFALNLVTLDIVVCDDLYTYLIGDSNINPEIPLCTSCDGQSSDMAYGKKCYDLGADDRFVNTLQLKFVRRKRAQVQHQNVQFTGQMYWNINDQGTCAAAMADKANFACTSNHSSCVDTTHMLGYSCSCAHGYRANSVVGYWGNSYVLNGCLRDHGYNPWAQRNVTCSRSCGKIIVPFPFGLERGCSARYEFQFFCVSVSASRIDSGVGSYIRHINISEGFLDTEDDIGSRNSLARGSLPYFLGNGDLLYPSRVQWVAANLTCKEARRNITTYACVSPNSKCLRVNSTYGDMGYRCKCKDGYAGKNPYVTGPDGCQDINECEIPGKCQEICHNTNGSYSCAKCPGEYDTIKMKCTPSRRQIVLLGVAIGLSVGFGLLLLGLTAIFLIRRWRRDIRKQLRRKYFAKNRGLLLEQLISSHEDASERTKIFSLKELEQATNNFDHTRILGHGGHGMVYKGILSDQRVVAIKKSKCVEQGEIDQFINEVAILPQINHRNIVKLYGCCLETEVPLLVYDFVPNGSLFEILHSGASNNFSLSWDDCLRIAAEAAGALYYLHSAASISVFHRDVKSSNILLDANYTAKVSDFGASRLVHIDQTHVSTHVQGTFGYLDPEYYHTGQLNEKSDVYSFGVVLLELLLRRKPIFTSESGLSAQNLASYFLGEMKERPIKEIVAPQVHEEATEEEITNVASLAEICLRLRGEERPAMKEVEMSLQLLRTNRLKSFHVTPENDGAMQSFRHERSEAVVQSHSSNTIDPISANNQRCYSLEQEFMSSASLPR